MEREAADIQQRGGDGTPSSSVAPLRRSTRKRKHPSVDPVQKKGPETTHLPPPPSENVDDFIELSSKASRSVVTVAAVMACGDIEYTSYHTGFILIREETYSLVFCCIPSEEYEVKKHFVYPNGALANDRAIAHIFLSDDKFLILSTRTAGDYAPVIFSDRPLSSGFIFTIGAMADNKLNADGNILHELVGVLGTYRGKVAVPSYIASDLQFRRLYEAEKFFEVTCPVHDDIITLENIDETIDPTVNIILSAPVFCLDGSVCGLIYSGGCWFDVRCGLHAEYIISHIKKLCNTSKKKWEEELKKQARTFLAAKSIHYS